jgi:hypothetical protein
MQPLLRVRSYPEGKQWDIPLELGAQQQLATQTLLVQPLPALTNSTTQWTLEYQAGGQSLHNQTVELWPSEIWEQQVAVVESCYVVGHPEQGWMRQREPPAAVSADLFGPCFVLQAPPHSAGVLPLSVYVRRRQRLQPRLIQRESLLVTDAPTVYVPGLFSQRQWPLLAGFELRCGSRVLAHISWSQAPQARFTAEGGFVPPPECVWNEATESELFERLSRLSQRYPDDKKC